MKTRQKLLTDEQWERIEPLLPKPKQREDKRGRPPTPNRPCFEGIPWILKTGAAWHFLSDVFPSPPTCWRRLQRWQEEGVWREA
jgi:transposase